MKIKLAERFHNDRPAYTKSKTGYIKDVLERAKLWRFPPEGSDYIIVDLEATCWETGQHTNRMEIIEIGAVRIDSKTKEPLDDFSIFVHPTEEPTLSDFCKKLTSITQPDIDNALLFPDAFEKFLEWVGDGPHRFCSWGAYDLKQFRVDCDRNNIPMPDWLEPHVNLRRMFSAKREIPSTTMIQALEILNIPLSGQHHRGIDDARNIAKIAKIILPYLGL
ncbi:MAG: exonuclease [Elusimicrobia bacterium]|nr:MAG: exonuclease [Elusimicrobiota bacterium]